jgi:NADH-quinone oxidoreductase subunit A
VFAIIFLAIVALLHLLSKAAVRTKDDFPSGKGKPYACGEDCYDHRIHPSYGQFFVFAVFFTIMHVVGLMLATLPGGFLMTGAASIAVLYLAGAITALFILYNR